MSFVRLIFLYPLYSNLRSHSEPNYSDACLKTRDHSNDVTTWEHYRENLG